MTILLDPANPYDFSREELEALAKTLEADSPGTDVVAAFRLEEGYGGPWSEVLYIWHEGKEVAETAVLLAGAVKWMKSRWHRDYAKHPDKPRPRNVVEIEEERIVRDVRIDLPDGEAVEEQITDETPPHRRPSLADGS